MSGGEWLILCVAALVLVPLALFALFLLWPLLLCWHLGSPLLGVLCEVIWLACLK